MLLQDGSIGHNWPDVANTFLLIIGPIAVIVAQFLMARSTKTAALQAAEVVKTELKSAAASSDKQLGIIHVLVNSTLTETQRQRQALTAQLEAAGITPMPGAPMPQKPLEPFPATEAGKTEVQVDKDLLGG